MDERIHKLWSVHTTECYSARKRNDVVTHYSVMNLETMLSERSQTPKVASCTIPFHKIHRTGKFTEMEGRLALPDGP